MQRITISVDDDLLAQFDGYMERKGYANRSEAFRDLLRNRLEEDRLATRVAGDCIACLSYVYNHHERQLPRRLVQAQHEHHDLGLSTLHVHLDHDNCLEAIILQGAVDAVRRFADTLSAERGVRHSNLHLVPVASDRARHAHGGDGKPRPSHRHSHPRT